jgi:hypothetical protein
VSFIRQHNAAVTNNRTAGRGERITEFFQNLAFPEMRPESPVARQSHQRAHGTVLRSPALQVETAPLPRSRVSARHACIDFVTTGDTSDRP